MRVIIPVECNHSEIIRPYTPTSTEAVTGHFDLVVKEYPTGVMSKHIASMKPGDSLEMKGPFPKVDQNQLGILIFIGGCHHKL